VKGTYLGISTQLLARRGYILRTAIVAPAMATMVLTPCERVCVREGEREDAGVRMARALRGRGP